MAHAATDQTLKALIDAIAPAREALVIDPDDTVTYDPPLKSIRAQGDGVVRLRPVDNAEAVDHPVLDGEYVPVRTTAILATGTTPGIGIIGYR